MDDIQARYEQRIEDIKTTANIKEPKRVPIMAAMTAFPIAYSGSKTRELINDGDKLAEKWTSIFDDIYFDCSLSWGTMVRMKMVETLQSKTYFISEDEVTIQHSENTPMLSEEYPELINDPITFMANKIFPRKFPALSRPYPENVEALKKAVLEMAEFARDTGKIIERGKNIYGVAPIVGSKLYPPLDLIFDRLRGFQGLFGDLRRVPEQVIAACEALYPIYMQVCEKGLTGEYPYAVTMLHCPAFLGPKSFEKFFWPTYKKMLLRVNELGTKTLMFLEGKWEPYYDFLRELPKASILCYLEADDIIEAKKKLGDKFAVLGGVPTSMLKYGNKQECIDEAKRIIDACAPGGGFLFTTERALISPADVNVENLKAVNEFVHAYGAYK
ncbi:hypothetical protein A7K50_09665 [Dehalobacter sp. MCB1]|uniref:uroporphyrinogen decarboxylase family protein n=1 Tax=unclassified Dehalobacter TaxID=2635733 RepID=UPI000E6BA292|nr:MULTISPECIES: uroporphyrinogen decarboxylase family protein [unclassified Dehalobacter]RJE48510.1 hypothetical protein A7K50_09665 [Dehalobacter sp. MCB1]TCX54827.1 hypothetical protein C1I38_03855 [Dehalobacter sp. 12DCB1]